MNQDKPVHATNVPSSPNQARRQVPQEEIARRAEKLWHDRNRPAGSDEAIWLEAESQLQAEAESRPVAGTESRPYVDEPAKPVKTQTKISDPAESGAQTRSATESKSRQSSGKLRNQ